MIEDLNEQTWKNPCAGYAKGSRLMEETTSEKCANTMDETLPEHGTVRMERIM
jgi:hypothetical protein